MLRCCFLVLVTLLIGSSVQAESRIDCSALNSRVLKQKVRYCVALPDGYDRAVAAHAKRYPVLYFLHGLGDNEQTLFNTGGWNLVEDLRQQHKIGDFLIVAPEGKQSFYINSADNKVRYSDFFLREFMPYIEHKYLIRRERSARGISGISMGGYGALRMAFAYPQLFSSVSAQSAALMTESPQQLDTAMRAGTPLSRMLAGVFGHPINVPHWRANDPFILARRNSNELRTLAIYFNCGDQDGYGFDKGAKALDRQLKAEGIPHEFHLYPGDHSLPYFLSHLGETMEFHWKAFQTGK
jgi:S-formylglutathione hydrolase FrmB